MSLTVCDTCSGVLWHCECESNDYELRWVEPDGLIFRIEDLVTLSTVDEVEFDE